MVVELVQDLGLVAFLSHLVVPRLLQFELLGLLLRDATLAQSRFRHLKVVRFSVADAPHQVLRVSFDLVSG